MKPPRGSQPPAPPLPCLHRRHAHSGNTKYSAAHRKTRQATTAAHPREFSSRYSGSRPRRTGTPYPATRTRRPCRRPDNPADGSPAEIPACTCEPRVPAPYPCGSPCLASPAAYKPPASSAFFPLPPDTSGRQPAASSLRNSRMTGSRCPPVWPHRWQACPEPLPAPARQL